VYSGDNAGNNETLRQKTIMLDDYEGPTDINCTVPVENSLYLMGRQMPMFSPATTMIVGPITFKATATANVDKMEFSIGEYNFIDHAADPVTGEFVWSFSERLFGLQTLKLTAHDYLGAEYTEEFTIRVYCFGYL
jgi:hypothetical protein